MELIKEAALNTLLGMGMTFLVLISLSLIIALFGKILVGGPKKSAAAEKGPEKGKEPVKEKVPVKQGSLAENSAQTLPGDENLQEAPASNPEEDTELMAVIAAAVAAYEEGGVSPDTVAVIAAAIAAYEGEENIADKAGASGFAVRRIRKSRKRIA